MFSDRQVVRRVNREFIPVALKAGLINDPPPGVEGDLYAEIARSRPAPQGICVANSAGKVLAWALSFDDDQSLPKFLDYALRRFKSAPDADEPVTAERFMKFPGQPLEDVADNGRTISIPDRHSDADRCPALPALESGTLVGRIIGRALDDNGQPLAEVLRQEHYMEARFEVPPDVQQRFIRRLSESDAGSFDVPDEFARLLVSQAYLGQLDVNPLGGRATGGRTDSASITFHAQRVSADGDSVTVRLTGSSDVSGGPAVIGVRTDGRQWEHRVRLEWEGYVTIEGDRMHGLAILARGTERLRWGNARWNLLDEPDVAHLMAGHPIDLDGDVQYGLLAQPCRAEEVVAADKGSLPAAPRPGDGSQQLAAALGPRFLIFADETAGELDLSDDQLAALAELHKQEQAAFDAFLQQFQQTPPDERPRRLDSYRQAATQRLDEKLDSLLRTEQSNRLRRVELRHQGLFALADPTIARDLHLTEQQQQRIVELVQEMQQQAQALQQQAGANPQRLQREMSALRSRQETAIADVLSESQRDAWSELTDPQE